MKKENYNNGKDRRKKRLNGRKYFAYIITNLIYIAMFCSILYKHSEILKDTLVYFIFAILLNMGTFLGLNTLDKFVNFKFFNKGD